MELLPLYQTVTAIYAKATFQSSRFRDNRLQPTKETEHGRPDIKQNYRTETEKLTLRNKNTHEHHMALTIRPHELLQESVIYTDRDL